MSFVEYLILLSSFRHVNHGNSSCPHCESSNTVRIGLLIGKWLHFCFDCGRRFEAKEERAET